MSSPEPPVKTDPEQRSSFGHLAEEAIKQPSPSDPIRTRKKIRGKWVKSNAAVGDLKIADATRLARELTGEEHVDLHLPEWAEICKDWNKYFWMKAEDVVYNRVFCLICHENVLEPAFGPHMRKVHKKESKDVTEVLKRMTAVRLSRFYCNGVVDKEELEENFPEELIPSIADLLKLGGCIIRQLRDSEKERKSVELGGRNKKRKGFRANDVVDLQEKRQEHSIKGITLRDAEDMALVLCDDTGSLPEVLFGEAVAPCMSSNRVSIHLRRDYCYSCQLNVPGREFERHFNVSNYGYHLTYNPTPEGAFEVMARMTEVRACRFFSANPVPLWKLKDICNGDEDLICQLAEFLQLRGFSINLNALEESASEWPIPTRVNDPLSTAESSADEEGYDPPTECSSVQASDSDSPCESYASSPASSRASSRCSSPAAESFTNIPYSVMNRIRLDSQIRSYLDEIDFILEEDEAFSPSQTQYMFIMGYAMYSLVVSNGCKLNVLNRLLIGDYITKFKLKNSKFNLLRFKTQGSCLGRPVEQWLVVDEETKRALDLYLQVRNRRARHMDCEGTMGHAECGFFISFYLKGMNGNDVDYPLSQFLRMCAVNWKFRARQFAAAVGALIARDPSKQNADYAFDFYKKLRAREQNQCEILGSPDSHPIIAGMNVEVGVKMRKDKGTIKGPMGPNVSTQELLLWRMKRKHPENDRVAKAFKKIRREYEKEFPSSGEEAEYEEDSSDPSSSGGSSPSRPHISTPPTPAYAMTPEPDDVDSRSRASTPVDSSPTRPYVSTPPPSSPSAYAPTPVPEELYCTDEAPRELTDLHLL